MRALLILNPYANRGRAGRRRDQAIRALQAAGVDVETRETRAAREAETLARQADDRFDAVIAAGGDGLVSEVVNGLIQAAGAGPTRPLGLMPIGTGNDFADLLGVPRDLTAAARVIAAGNTRQIDAARVNDRYFDNNCAAAMEPLVTIENTRIQRVKGNLRYVLSLARALWRLRAWRMRIEWDDGAYDGPVYLLSVCNGVRCGGLFPIAPAARFDDGLLDFVLAPEMRKLDVFRLLLMLFRGRHGEHPLVITGRTRRLRLESQPGTPIHADGEIIAEAATRVELEISPGKITLLCP